jgi:hypothetical protein
VSTGGTVEELAAQVDALVGAIVMHNAVIQDAEQRSIAQPLIEAWADIAAVHREIVDEYVVEVRLLRAEIALIPPPRQPAD